MKQLITDIYSRTNFEELCLKHKLIFNHVPSMCSILWAWATKIPTSGNLPLRYQIFIPSTLIYATFESVATLGWKLAQVSISVDVSEC